MTRGEAIEILKNLPYLATKSSVEDIERAICLAIKALSQEPTDENLHREREQAYMQGYEDASKRFRQEPCDDVVSRKAVLNAIEHEDKWLLAAKGHNGLTEIAFSGLKARVDALPSVTQKSGKCKTCKYWQDNNNGYPSNMCKWRTDETPDADDYCSEYEPQEGSDKE